MADSIPKVSICLPNLNNRKFLQVRLETIFQQTFQDWELIVVDNYSDDGAWEFLSEQAKLEKRLRLSQAPRKGMYTNWNNCIQQARGKYVYIATSDDTMSPDCLEKLVAALDQHPDCGLAHCCLTFIDEQSRPMLTGQCWDNWHTTRFMGEWNTKPHVRPQGHDTVMALGLRTAYYSITQILVRRSLFDKVGMFETRWGPNGDLEWQMRAALATKTVHVPEYLATWRIHPKQATQQDRYLKAVREGCFVRMADSVIRFSRKHNLPFPGGLPRRLQRFYWDEYLSHNHLRDYQSSFTRRMRTLIHFLAHDPALIRPYLQGRWRKRDGNRAPDLEFEVREELHLLKLDTVFPA